MKVRYALSLCFLFCMVCHTWGQQPQAAVPTASVPMTPEGIARRCIRHIQETAESVNEFLGGKARRCVHHIMHLLNEGNVDQANAAGQRCGESIHRAAARGVDRVTRLADQCLETLTDLNASEEIKARVREAAARAVNSIQNHAERALAAIDEALGS